MSIEGELVQAAREAATHAQQRATHIHEEYLHAQKRALELKAQFDLANLALKRLDDFKVRIGRDLQCPYCWAERATQCTIYPVGGAPREDIYRCDYGHEYRVTF